MSRKLLPLVLAATTLWVPQDANADPVRPPGPDGLAEVIKAMSRDLHIDEATARRRLVQEEAAATAEAALVPALGTAYGGSWFDARTGKLVVNVTDPAKAPVVSAQGATPKLLKNGYSMARLTAVKAKLDHLARTSPSSVRGVRSWSIDPVANRVVVTRLAGAEGGALAEAALAQGDAVRFETTTQPAVSTGVYLDGGEGINSGKDCSLGFNARLTYSDLPGVSDPVVLSAGHCANLPTVTGYGNTRSDQPTRTSYPLGRWWLVNRDYDWGVIGSLDLQRWAQGPYIALHTPGDHYLNVTGTQQRPEGSSICKSGFKTRITCGVIVRRGEPIWLWDAGRTVFNLTRHTACTDPGDSGGPVYTADGHAQGVVSSSGVGCSQPGDKYGWYVEINHIQGASGARVLTL
ncbi:S1 family peptidase [Herbidospora cretacea]|uniref:S1 family peptidase n=1 Tax=Herbidospora cretacea TaxID=28444 RepID=UPI0018CC4BAE|nr:S1 family peptidase [Herbidospora cretacea]